MKGIGKVLIRLLTVALAVVFVVSGYHVWEILHDRRTAETAYEDLDAFVRSEGTEAGTETREEEAQDGAVSLEDSPSAFPEVDFDGLRSINEQVVGWIYDDASVINYPIVQARDNDYYLYRLFNGESNPSGAIFLDCQNQSDFSDSHCIIYGHHMKDGSMFAALAEYADQTFYEEHPVMWLLTPEQDYKIIVFSGYTASAGSDTYQIFEGASGEFDEYLETVQGRSDFTADMEPDGAAKYVLLSTCAYDFEDARYVIHGMLVPVGSAAGVPGEAGQRG